jgi:RNA polymerase sigma factor (sigma-70 family)
MDQLLQPYLQAANDSDSQQQLEELLLFHAAPVVRQTLRRKLGFYVNQHGKNPRNQDAEDLYQDIMTKIVQTLHNLRDPPANTEIDNFKQYVARIAANACNDVLRAKSPVRARLKNNLRYLLTHHRDFAVWKMEDETLSGFALWRDTSKSTSSEKAAADLDERLAEFRARRFPRQNIQEVPVTKIVAELFHWTGSPIALDALVQIIAKLLDVQDHPVESLDDDTQVETTIAQSTVTSSSRVEEQSLLRSLWHALKELSVEQRDVFCLGFEDESGRDFFTVVLEAEVVSFGELVHELGRSAGTIVRLWSQMPMDDEEIAVELKTKRTQVQKWRFRALQRLKKGLLPFRG